MAAERCGTTVRLVAFDLDGTLLRGDTVCEGIARRLGHLERMREFERLTEIGAMAAAREELAGYYRQVTTAVLQDCLGTLCLAPGAVEGVRLLRRHGIEVAIVSITWAFAVEWFARRLGAGYWIGTGLSPDGLTIAHFWPEDKARWLRELMGRLDLQASQVAAVGDSRGDLAMLRLVGHPFYVGARPPPDLTARHLPGGDIREIAQAIIDRAAGSAARIAPMPRRPCAAPALARRLRITLNRHSRGAGVRRAEPPAPPHRRGHGRGRQLPLPSARQLLPASVPRWEVSDE